MSPVSAAVFRYRSANIPASRMKPSRRVAATAFGAASALKKRASSYS